MLPTALILTGLGVLMLLLALRGRVTARGLFCRRCKFDLAGLDPARDNPTCPECGRDLTQPRSTRTTLRRIHRPALAAAILCVLFATPLFLTQSAAVRAWLVTRAPDPALAWLERLDLEGADAEIIARLADPLKHRTAFLDRIDRAIDRVLTDKLNAPANDRAVVLTALRNTQLSEAQAARFLEAVIDARIAIRDKAHPHQTTVPSAWTVNARFHEFFPPDEMFAGGNPAYSIEHGFHRGGPAATVTLDPTKPPAYDTRALQFYGGRSLMPDDTTPLRDRGTPEPAPGDSIAVHAALSVRIHSPRSPDPILTIWRTAEQTVTIVPADQPLVPTVDDPEALAALAATLSMREVRVFGSPDSPLLAAFAISDAPAPAHAAFRSTMTAGDLTLLSEELLVLAPYNFPAISQGYAQTAFQASLRDPEARARFEAISPNTTVTIILRPDPVAAYRYAELASCLAGELIFQNIPILFAQQQSPTGTPVLHPAQVHTPLPKAPPPDSPEP